MAGATPSAKVTSPAIRRRGRPPNLLLIVTDQEQPWVLFPQSLQLSGRDALAEQATHFTQFHISGTVCSPCRSVLYTGQHWQQTGIFDNIGYPEMNLFSPEKTPTLGNMLEARGYRTGYRGKWHVTRVLNKEAEANRPALQSCGFATYQDLPDANGPHDGYRRDPVALSDAESFIAEAERDERPWFLALNYINPHDIMFLRAFDGQKPLGGEAGIRPPPDDPIYKTLIDDPSPPNLGTGDLASKPQAVRDGNDIYKLILGDVPFDDPAVAQSFRQYYFACLRDVDRYIGATLDFLARSGQAENTIIAFTADHGEMLGAHGLRDKGSVGYRELVNVPFLVAHPDLVGGRETKALMSQIDIAPTLLSLLGVSATEIAERYPDLKGRDMSGAAAGTDDPRAASGVLFQAGNLMFLDPEYPRERFRRGVWGFSQKNAPEELRGIERNMSARGIMRGVHDGRYKLIRWFAANDHHVPADFATLRARNDLELYDTAADPFETNNLASDAEAHRGEIERLNMMLSRLIADEVGKDDGSWMVL
jgi:arylsulfatase A-like enzyme